MRKEEDVKRIIYNLSDEEFSKSLAVFEHIKNIDAGLTVKERFIPLEKIVGSISKKDIDIAVSVAQDIHETIEEKLSGSDIAKLNVYTGSESPHIRDVDGNGKYGPFLVGVQSLPLEDIIKIYEDLDKKGKTIEKIDGKYYFNGKALNFKENATYTLIFDFLFELPDRYASYNRIDTYLGVKGKGTKDTEARKSSRIREAIRTYDDDEGKPTEIRGEKVLKIRGKGVELNI